MKLTFPSAEEKARYMRIVVQRHEARVERDLTAMGADVGVAVVIRQAVEARH